MVLLDLPQLKKGSFQLNTCTFPTMWQAPNRVGNLSALMTFSQGPDNTSIFGKADGKKLLLLFSW